MNWDKACCHPSPHDIEFLNINRYFVLIIIHKSIFNMSFNPSAISKNQLLLYFSNIDQLNYKCNTCNKIYKTPNGGKTNQPQKNNDTVVDAEPHYKNNVGGPKAKIITDSIIYYFVKDNISFKTIENEEFKQILLAICPLYKLPGQDTIARQIDDLYTVMASEFREELSKVLFVSITTDVWTETMQMSSFLGMTTYLIQDGKLKTQNIGTVELFKGHTAIYIGHNLIETLQSWGLEAQ
ncbi:hypothetical protein AGLY_003476 [Aphis glycines]|uniref:BED-type domain-containing protein n=1 Tax=Aphis glycines TaxID=307491 RepID=A0A6G0U148_APHGL|nr:hypothetical protein AGLY_003476 [Aphis glycines]